MLLTSMEKSKRECEGPDVSELSYICIISELRELSV